MEPNRGGRGLERRHALGQQAGGHSGQHVAGAGGRQIGRRIRRDRRTAVGGRDHGIGALEENDRAGDLGRETRSLEFRADFSSSRPMHRNNRENSPSCGVRIVASSGARFERLGEPLRSTAQSSSWHRRRAPRRASPESAASTSSQVASPTPMPGPIANAFNRRSARNVASSAAPSTGRTITARLGCCIDRQRLARAGDGHQPRPGAQRAAGRKPRRPGRPRWTGNDDRMAAVVFVAVMRAAPESYRAKAPAHSRMSAGQCARAPMPECRCRRRKSCRNEAGRATADGRAFCERR